MPARKIGKTNDGTRTAGLAAMVLAIIAGLWTADLMLARAERAERRDEAHGDWSSGMRLLAAGRATEAEDWLRKAYAIDRTNASYGLDLATALTAGGKSTTLPSCWRIC